MPDSEFAFLAMLDRHFPREHASLVLPRGDDCAVVAWPERVCVSLDLFLEHSHFRRTYFTPREIGHKALAVNLSDLAGMGAAPLGFCMGLHAPPGLEDSFWEEFFAGMAGLANEWGAPCIGGDLSRSEHLGVAITVWGHAQRPVPRGQARFGDVLFCCGPAPLAGRLPLGLARTGLLLLEKHPGNLGSEARRLSPLATAAHLRPQPLLTEGRILAAHPGVNSLMDVSDGLVRDLPRLLGAELAPGEGRRSIPGARLQILPRHLHPEILSRHPDSAAALEQAVLGGEDYCLLGTCTSAAAEELRATLPGFLPLGVVTAAPGLFVNDKPLPPAGFDHFGP